MNINLRPVYKNTSQSIGDLYALLKERSEDSDPHINISHSDLPVFFQHARFVRSRPYRVWYLIVADGLVAGSVNITRLNEVGIVLAKDHRGRGIGRIALKLLLQRHKPLPAIPAHRSGRFLANVNPKNARSIRLFERLGFVHVQNTYSLP